MRPRTIYTYKDYGIRPYQNLTFNTTEEFLKQLDERRVYCQNCGHTLFMDYKTQELICSYCGHKVKKQGKILFKDKMRVLLNEEKNGKRDKCK